MSQIRAQREPAGLRNLVMRAHASRYAPTIRNRVRIADIVALAVFVAGSGAMLLAFG